MVQRKMTPEITLTVHEKKSGDIAGKFTLTSGNLNYFRKHADTNDPSKTVTYHQLIDLMEKEINLSHLNSKSAGECVYKWIRTKHPALSLTCEPSPEKRAVVRGNLNSSEWKTQKPEIKGGMLEVMIAKSGGSWIVRASIQALLAGVDRYIEKLTSGRQRKSTSNDEIPISQQQLERLLQILLLKLQLRSSKV